MQKVNAGNLISQLHENEYSIDHEPDPTHQEGRTSNGYVVRLTYYTELISQGLKEQYFKKY